MHFRTDTKAGTLLAGKIFPLLGKVKTFDALLEEARGEWAGLSKGREPDPPVQDEASTTKPNGAAPADDKPAVRT